MQADEDPYVHVLSSTGSTVQVAFYATDVQRLAGQHAVVDALLRAARKPRNGCYRVATAALVAECDQPPYMVRRDPLTTSIGNPTPFSLPQHHDVNPQHLPSFANV